MVVSNSNGVNSNSMSWQALFSLTTVSNSNGVNSNLIQDHKDQHNHEFQTPTE